MNSTPIFSTTSIHPSPGLLANPLAANARQRLLASENGGDGEDGAVQEDLRKLELDPVHEEQTFECAEGENEREDGG